MPRTQYLSRSRHTAGLTVLRIPPALGMVVGVRLAGRGTVVNAADASMGRMATINLMPLVLASLHGS